MQPTYAATVRTCSKTGCSSVSAVNGAGQGSNTITYL